MYRSELTSGMFDNKQLVAIASGSNILVFGLTD
jgi:hypothetical protein